MDLIKATRAIVAGAIGLSLGMGAACIIQEPARAPQQPPPPAPATATAAQPGAPAAAALPNGWYYCQFSQGNASYKRYFCRVYSSGNAQHIQKAGGFEKFAGTFAVAGSGMTLNGRSSCNKMGTNCKGSFTVAMARAGSVFRGQVRSDKSWWLNNGTLTLQFISTQAPRGAYGGAGYAGASYGGSSYGGRAYGGSSYGR